MAHARSLAQRVVQSGILAEWPGEVFAFSLSEARRLTVKTQQSSKVSARRVPARPVFDRELAVAPDDSALAIDSSSACLQIHQHLEVLPTCSEPSDVRFANGLYFFYEQGEEGEHGTPERIVRIGNHPLKQDRLVGRLSDHFKGSRNAKNGSVFRRYLGGALIRKRMPESDCLLPGAGMGHWEHGGGRECSDCCEIEAEVGVYLAQRMYFRCVCVEDRALRNRFEKLLLATVAQCAGCRPSESWLGSYAYPGIVNSSGLWNVLDTGGTTASTADLEILKTLVEASQPGEPSC
jgi:hypothetical protein